ncbi:hypothetical protein ES703_11261 [subsurface metagenome]
MLDEISPVQFIEGVNEYAEPLEDQGINTRGYSGVAIEYLPKLSYTLKKLDIFLKHKEPPHEGKCKVALCTSDPKGNPSDIVLSEGGFAWKQTLGDWQQVELEPIVVRPSNKYWLTIDLDGGYIVLPIAKEGDESALRFRGKERWRTHDLFKANKVMLRFYGRVLPVPSQHSRKEH